MATFSGTYTNGIVLSNPATQNPATVTATGYLSKYNGAALLGAAGTAWTIDNLGTVAGKGPAGNGIVLDGGGTIVNGQSGSSAGLIGGANDAVSIAGGPASLANYGTISGIVLLQSTATVVNSGSIASLTLVNGGSVGNGLGGTLGSAGYTSLYAAAGAATLGNAGTVSGVDFSSGGVVQNGSPGTIGNITIGGGYATVTNTGMIRGNGTAVLLEGIGKLFNSGTIAVASGTGAALDDGGTAINAGSIAGAGYGISIGAAGGTLTNLGTISATGTGVAFAAGGSLYNGSQGVISGGAGGLYAATPVAIVNQGLITSPIHQQAVVGVDLAQGGTIDNKSGAAIIAYAGAVVIGGPGSVSNEGVLQAFGSNVSGIGLYLGASGIQVVNTGTIEGNSGIATGAGDTAGNTIVNAGTISGAGPIAVRLGSGDLLVADPGAMFTGVVDGDGSDTLELAAGTGTLSGLGTQFAGFATVRVDPGANWTLDGAGPGFVNDGTVTVAGALSFGAVTHDTGQTGVIQLAGVGSAEFTQAVGKGEMLVFTDNTGTVLLDQPHSFKATIAGFAAGDVIDLVGTKADALSFSNHQLMVTEHGHTVADLHLAGHYTTQAFSLSPDGNGGTDITLTAPVAGAFWTLPG